MAGKSQQFTRMLTMPKKRSSRVLRPALKELEEKVKHNLDRLREESAEWEADLEPRHRQDS